MLTRAGEAGGGKGEGDSGRAVCLERGQTDLTGTGAGLGSGNEGESCAFILLFRDSGK